MRTISYDSFYEEWTCDLGGPGDPKIVCDSKDKLERFLDWIDNRKRTEVTHVGTDTEGGAADRDWRGAESC